MKGVQPNGYTILELLIVIAVSATMFISVAIAFGGRQQQIQFTQSVRAFEAKLQDVINDVSSGYYDNEGTISCSVGALATSRPQPDGTSITPDEQGSSNNCIFIGKAIQFAPSTSGGTPEAQPATIYIYNIIGRRTNTAGTVNSLEEARPVAVAPTDQLTDPLNLGEQVSRIPLDWGLQVTDVKDNATAAGNEFGTIGFFTSFARSFSNSVTTTDISNNQLVRYGAIPLTQKNEESYTAVQKINSITDRNPPVGSDRFVDLSGSRSITICLKNADGNRRAAIVIGADGTTTTKLQFDDYDGGKCVS